MGYRRRRSHALCAVDRCPVLDPAVEDALHALARSDAPEDGEWELCGGEDGVRCEPLRRGRARRGGRRVHVRAGEDRIRVSPGVFAQSNARLLAPLVAAVTEAAGRGDRALDLFAGAGFFTLPLARRFGRVVAVESDAPAAADLRANLKDAPLDNVRVLGEPVERALARGILADAEPDAIVVDPPRPGLPDGTPERLADLGAARIVYLSCNPTTLARDLAHLTRRGYALRTTTAIDLFPQTPHIEALTVLDRV